MRMQFGSTVSVLWKDYLLSFTHSDCTGSNSTRSSSKVPELLSNLCLSSVQTRYVSLCSSKLLRPVADSNQFEMYRSQKESFNKILRINQYFCSLFSVRSIVSRILPPYILLCKSLLAFITNLLFFTNALSSHPLLNYLCKARRPFISISRSS